MSISSTFWGVAGSILSRALYDPFGVDVPLNFDIIHSSSDDCTSSEGIWCLRVGGREDAAPLGWVAPGACPTEVWLRMKHEIDICEIKVE